MDEQRGHPPQGVDKTQGLTRHPYPTSFIMCVMEGDVVKCFSICAGTSFLLFTIMMPLALSCEKPMRPFYENMAIFFVVIIMACMVASFAYSVYDINKEVE